MENKRGTGKRKKPLNKEEFEYIYVDIIDILEKAKEIVISCHGGIGASEVEYIGNVSRLKFKIPKKDRKGKCQEINPPQSLGYENQGCGMTGGSCICGKDEDHEGDHQCELCGEIW